MENILNSTDFYNVWSQYDSVSVFGLGHICKNALSDLKQLTKVDFIFDNNIELDSRSFEGVTVKAYQAEVIRKHKILVSTHYKNIKDQLEQIGLRENVDFCGMEKF